MYHRVASEPGCLTVTPDQLSGQLRWLADCGFACISGAALLEHIVGGQPLPEWPVLVTFDDAYRDTFELARPVLRELRVPAVIFVPTAFVGRTNEWDGGGVPLMNREELRQMGQEGFEFGLHSHTHRSFASLSLQECGEELRKNSDAVRALGLGVLPLLAYPYGARPVGDVHRVLHEAGVVAALRIGNRVNGLPFRDTANLNRIGVRGDRSFSFFKRQICWGRLLG